MSKVLAEIRHLVVMGVAGSGKSTIGSALASRLGWVFLEGDHFHPPQNLEKMSRGESLTDTDRWPWLEALASEMAVFSGRGQSTVVACSALRGVYREIFRKLGSGIQFVFLHVDRDELAHRLEIRTGHFADARILDSQLGTLEPPLEGDSLRVDGTAAPSEIVQDILVQFGLVSEKSSPSV